MCQPVSSRQCSAAAPLPRISFSCRTYVLSRMPPWSVPDHMRKPRRTTDAVQSQSKALAPVWVEADELNAFKAWWDRLARGERTARRAFLYGLQRSDAA